MAAAGLLGLALCPGFPASAQSTVDGSHCLVFVPGTVHGELARCVRLLGKDHPLRAATLSVVLMGDAPNRVSTIALSVDGAAPFQVLALEAYPPISASDVGMIFADMDFDGFSDFGIMATSDGAEHLRWFVFDPEHRRFAANAFLSALIDPRPDRELSRIVVRRRSAPPGLDFYRWHNGLLLHEERIERRCAGGRCRCRHLSPRRHGFGLLRDVPCL